MYDTTKPHKTKIIELIKNTWETPYVSVADGVVKKKFHFREFHHSDGIGTKGVFHWSARSFKSAVEDAMAMNLNDCAMNRAYPYAVIDHVMVPYDDNDAILAIISHLTEECRKRSIAITGGETAVLNTLRGLEISITMLGFIKKPRMNLLRVGDMLIGVGSSGLHANGFTRVRDLFGELAKEEFILPTYDYSRALLKIGELCTVHGMMHITGGAFTKLKDVLPEYADAVFWRDHRLKPQQIFYEIYMRGVSEDEMYKTFNCGIGFVLGVSSKDVPFCLRMLSNFKADIVGEVVAGTGRVKIQSQFSAGEITY